MCSLLYETCAIFCACVKCDPCLDWYFGLFFVVVFFWSVIPDRVLFIRWVLFELDFWGTHVVRIDICNCASMISVIRMRSRDLVINKVIYVLRDSPYILCDALLPFIYKGVKICRDVCDDVIWVRVSSTENRFNG